MRLLLKYATRQRPEKFKSTLKRYIDYLSLARHVDFIISFDEDDASMANPEMVKFLEEIEIPTGSLFYFSGQSKNKIDACNRDLDNVLVKEKLRPDIIMLISDDQIPQVRGYDEIIVSAMEQHFPNRNGVLQYHDGFIGERLNTQSIMGIEYYNQFGYIYHPDYVSFCCDNEFTEVSHNLGKVVYFDRCIVSHLHPVNTKEPHDELYIRNYATWFSDKMTYDLRKANGFPKASLL